MDRERARTGGWMRRNGVVIGRCGMMGTHRDGRRLIEVLGRDASWGWGLADLLRLGRARLAEHQGTRVAAETRGRAGAGAHV